MYKSFLEVDVLNEEVPSSVPDNLSRDSMNYLVKIENFMKKLSQKYIE